MSLSYRLIAALLIGISGLAVMLSMIWPVPVDQMDWTFPVAAAIGATAAGALFAPLFGRTDRKGLQLFLLGAVLSTVVGSAFAGLGSGLYLGLGLAGAVIAPLGVAEELVTSPGTLAVWIVTMVVAQLIVNRVRVSQLA